MVVCAARLSHLVRGSYDRYQELDTELKKLVECRKETIRVLNEIAEQLDKVHKDVNIAKMTGSTVGIVGGAIATVGAALIPFTVGVSTILVGVGSGASALGGLVAGGASIVELCIDGIKNSKAQEQIQRDKQQCERVKSFWERYDVLNQDIIAIIKRGVPPSDAAGRSLFMYLKQAWEKFKSIRYVDAVMDNSMVCLLMKVFGVVKNFDSIVNAAKDVIRPILVGLKVALRENMLEKIVMAVEKYGLTITRITMCLSLTAIGMVLNIVTFVTTLYDISKGSPSEMAKKIREQVKELELEQTAWKEMFMEVDETSQYLSEEVKCEIEERLEEERRQAAAVVRRSTSTSPTHTHLNRHVTRPFLRPGSVHVHYPDTAVTRTR